MLTMRSLKSFLNVYLIRRRSMGGEVTTDGDFLIFESNRYSRNGFLFKNFVMSAIVSIRWNVSTRLNNSNRHHHSHVKT